MTDTKRAIIVSILIIICIAVIIFFTSDNLDVSSENGVRQVQDRDDMMDGQAPIMGRPPLEVDTNLENEIIELDF